MRTDSHQCPQKQSVLSPHLPWCDTQNPPKDKTSPTVPNSPGDLAHICSELGTPVGGEVEGRASSEEDVHHGAVALGCRPQQRRGASAGGSSEVRSGKVPLPPPLGEAKTTARQPFCPGVGTDRSFQGWVFPSIGEVFRTINTSHLLTGEVRWNFPQLGPLCSTAEFLAGAEQSLKDGSLPHMGQSSRALPHNWGSLQDH